MQVPERQAYNGNSNVFINFVCVTCERLYLLLNIVHSQIGKVRGINDKVNVLYLSVGLKIVSKLQKHKSSHCLKCSILSQNG